MLVAEHLHTVAAVDNLEEDSQVARDSPVVDSQVAEGNPEEGIRVVGDNHIRVVGDNQAAVVDNLDTANSHRALAEAWVEVPPFGTSQAAAWRSRATQQFGFAQVVHCS